MEARIREMESTIEKQQIIEVDSTMEWIPETYESLLGIRETEVAIKVIKDFFERHLAKALNLTRVSAPLFVRPETGLNDDLNGVERPVAFDVKDTGETIQVVQSLAKWKRMALHRYGFEQCEGLYTDMNAIRRDEELDNLHSIYVDQWDWEAIIGRDERTMPKLKDIVERIYGVFKATEKQVFEFYPHITPVLPESIKFLTTQELEDLYPQLTPKQREDAITKEHGAVFLMQIGGDLKSGQRHDGRAPDYDDWTLNGDILFWYPVLGRALELSSMGIRVDREALHLQLRKAEAMHKLEQPFHKLLDEEVLPQTVGGGIGQSRICMFFLRKAHIGEVQAGIWPQRMVDRCSQAGIELL